MATKQQNGWKMARTKKIETFAKHFFKRDVDFSFALEYRIDSDIEISRCFLLVRLRERKNPHWKTQLFKFDNQNIEMLFSLSCTNPRFQPILFKLRIEFIDEAKNINIIFRLSKNLSNNWDLCMCMYVCMYARTPDWVYSIKFVLIYRFNHCFSLFHSPFAQIENKSQP